MLAGNIEAAIFRLKKSPDILREQDVMSIAGLFGHGINAGTGRKVIGAEWKQDGRGGLERVVRIYSLGGEVVEWPVNGWRAASDFSAENKLERAIEYLQEWAEKYCDTGGKVPSQSRSAPFGQSQILPSTVNAATTKNDHDSLPQAQSGRPVVVLRTRREGPIVRGIPKKPLTAAQFDVVKTLIDAGDDGLSKDDLDRLSGRTEARKRLKGLAEKDADWKAVIHFPGTPGRGYRIG